MRDSSDQPLSPVHTMHIELNITNNALLLAGNALLKTSLLISLHSPLETLSYLSKCTAMYTIVHFALKRPTCHALKRPYWNFLFLSFKTSTSYLSTAYPFYLISLSLPAYGQHLHYLLLYVYRIRILRSNHYMY